MTDFVTLLPENSCSMDGSGGYFTTHKSAHNSVHNLQFFMRLADGAVKMGNSD